MRRQANEALRSGPQEVYGEAKQGLIAIPIGARKTRGIRGAGARLSSSMREVGGEGDAHGL